MERAARGSRIGLRVEQGREGHAKRESIDYDVKLEPATHQEDIAVLRAALEGRLPLGGLPG